MMVSITNEGKLPIPGSYFLEESTIRTASLPAATTPPADRTAQLENAEKELSILAFFDMFFL